MVGNVLEAVQLVGLPTGLLDPVMQRLRAQPKLERSCSGSLNGPQRSVNRKVRIPGPEPICDQASTLDIVGPTPTDLTCCSPPRSVPRDPSRIRTSASRMNPHKEWVRAHSCPPRLRSERS